MPQPVKPPHGPMLYPADYCSAEWAATYCWNYLHGYANGNSYFITNEGKLVVPDEKISELGTYEAMLEYIETEIAILRIKNAATA